MVSSHTNPTTLSSQYSAYSPNIARDLTGSGSSCSRMYAIASFEVLMSPRYARAVTRDPRSRLSLAGGDDHGAQRLIPPDAGVESRGVRPLSGAIGLGLARLHDDDTAGAQNASRRDKHGGL